LEFPNAAVIAQRQAVGPVGAPLVPKKLLRGWHELFAPTFEALRVTTVTIGFRFGSTAPRFAE